MLVLPRAQPLSARLRLSMVAVVQGRLVTTNHLESKRQETRMQHSCSPCSSTGSSVVPTAYDWDTTEQISQLDGLREQNSKSALCVDRGARTRGPAPRNLVTVAIYHARSVTACSSIIIGAVEL